MNVDGAYKILTKYQLLNFNDGLERVFTIQERSEKFRHSISKPNEIGLARRVREVLDACKTIENSIQIESEELYKARTITQKSNAIEKASGYKPGEIHIYARGNWREPKWKLKQFKLRALAYIYLARRGLID